MGTYSWLIWARYHHNRGRTISWLPGPRLVTEAVQIAWTKELNDTRHRHDEIISPVNNHTKYKKASKNHYTPPSQSFKPFKLCGASWQLRQPRSLGGHGGRRLNGGLGCLAVLVLPPWWSSDFLLPLDSCWLEGRSRGLSLWPRSFPSPTLLCPLRPTSGRLRQTAASSWTRGLMSMACSSFSTGVNKD